MVQKQYAVIIRPEAKTTVDIGYALEMSDTSILLCIEEPQRLIDALTAGKQHIFLRKAETATCETDATS